MASQANHLVMADRLATLLNVRRETIAAWKTKNILVGKRINRFVHYSSAVVNAFLAQCIHNLESPVTLEQLINGETELLDVAQAAEFAGVSKEAIRRWVEQGRVLYVIFPRCLGKIRIVKSCLKRKLRQRPHPTTAQVALMIGFTDGAVRRFVREGKLKKVILSNRLRPTYVTFDSFMRFLKTRLPYWIDPVDWIDDRLACGLPLLATDEASRQLGTRLQLEKAVEQRQIQFVNRTIKNRPEPGFSPESIAAYVERQPIIPIDTIATIFGSKPITVRYHWVKKGYVICPLHAHTGWDYKKVCLLAYLNSVLPGQADEWYDQQTTNPQELFEVSYAMRYLKLSWHEVQMLLGSGLLQGLRLPSGSYRFNTEQLQDCAAKLSNKQ
ncbi:MAG TPA: helix-turn-helix domain-containing protein [Candidatus Saccharimonas sp.]|nr:helix-turn-helix domain-containing protein [Candidatus Saccharimonas sp.]